MIRSLEPYTRIAMLLPAIFLILCGSKSNVSTVQAENCFIIVMNGVRYHDAFGDKNHLYIDNIWNKLRPRGTICTRFVNGGLTFPIPSQMSLLTGVWHIFENPLSENIRPAFPTLFEYWNEAVKDSGNHVYFASNDARYEIMTCSNHADFGAPYAPVFEFSNDDGLNQNSIYEKALPYILENRPSFIYLSLGSGGGGGTEADMHADDCMLPGEKDACGGETLLNDYYESIIQMDAIVYDLWDRIQQEKQYKNNTLFIVLSSHGRHTDDFHSYGDKSKGCTQLYMLAVGPGVKKGFVSKKKRTLIDVCKTAGVLTGIPTPHAKGNVMSELFE